MWREDGGNPYALGYIRRTMNVGIGCRTRRRNTGAESMENSGMRAGDVVGLNAVPNVGRFGM